MKKAIILGFLSLFYFPTFAQQLNSAKLDSLFLLLQDNHKWMGSIAISKDAKVIYSNAIGLADAKKMATTSSKYRIGSISKMFTATLIFTAIEAKKLALNETIEKYFPTVKNADKITISNLLNHHSSIYNFTNSPSYQTWMGEKKSRDEMIAIISAAPSDFEPGSKAAYSNSNYVLLGYILETIYQKPYREILADKITRPLGLTNTYLGDKIANEKNEVNSYVSLQGWVLQPETDMSIPFAAGAIVSNPTDLNKFITALFDGKIVSAESLAQMKNITDNYGYGMRSFQFDNKTGYGHNGGIDAFSSMLYYLPDDKLSVAITSNGNAYDNNKIFTTALNAYYGKPITLPSFKTLTLTSEALDQYLGEYTAPNIPLVITISKNGNILVSQATGQSAINMEATGKDRFEFSKAGIILEFKPTEKQMVLTQGQGRYVFTKSGN